MLERTQENELATEKAKFKKQWGFENFFIEKWDFSRARLTYTLMRESRHGEEARFVDMSLRNTGLL